jgi:hypothetical protein
VTPVISEWVEALVTFSGLFPRTPSSSSASKATSTTKRAIDMRPSNLSYINGDPPCDESYNTLTEIPSPKVEIVVATARSSC